MEYLSEKEFQNIDFLKKKNKKHQNIDTCKNMEFFFKCIMLSERSQPQKVTFYMSIFIWLSRNTVTENRLRLPEPGSRGRIV